MYYQAYFIDTIQNPSYRKIFLHKAKKNSTITYFQVYINETGELRVRSCNKRKRSRVDVSVDEFVKRSKLKSSSSSSESGDSHDSSCGEQQQQQQLDDSEFVAADDEGTKIQAFAGHSDISLHVCLKTGSRKN